MTSSFRRSGERYSSSDPYRDHGRSRDYERDRDRDYRDRDRARDRDRDRYSDRDRGRDRDRDRDYELEHPYNRDRPRRGSRDSISKDPLPPPSPGHPAKTAPDTAKPGPSGERTEGEKLLRNYADAILSSYTCKMRLEMLHQEIREREECQKAVSNLDGYPSIKETYLRQKRQHDGQLKQLEADCSTQTKKFDDALLALSSRLLSRSPPSAQATPSSSVTGTTTRSASSNASLEARLASLEEGFAKQNERVETLEKQQECLHKDLEEKAELLDEKSREIATLKEKLNSESVVSQDAKHGNVERELETLGHQYKEISNKVFDIEQDMSSIRGDVEYVRKKVNKPSVAAQSQAPDQSLLKRVVKLEADAQESKTILDSHATDLSKIDLASLDEYADIASHLPSDLRNLAARFDTAKETLGHLDTSNKDLLRRVGVLESNTSSLDAKASDLEAARTGLQKDIHGLRTFDTGMVKMFGEMVDKLEQRCSKLEKRVESVQTPTSNDNGSPSLAADVIAVQEELQTVRKDVEQVSSNLLTKDEVTSCRTLLPNVPLALQRLETHHESLKQIQFEVSCLNDSINKIQTKDLADSIIATLTRLYPNARELTASVKQLDHRLTSLQQQVSGLYDGPVDKKRKLNAVAVGTNGGMVLGNGAPAPAPAPAAQTDNTGGGDSPTNNIDTNLA